jgi:hypothetical protein
MALSGSTDFTQTASEIIYDAFMLLGVYSSGETASSGDLSLAQNILNKMFKAWEGKGIHLWTEQEGAIFLTEGQQSYSLTSASTDIAGDDPRYTTLTSDASGTTLVVTSTTGMAAADNIGVKLDDNTLHWTTIVSVDSATGLTITTGLASAASSGNNVFTFTNRVNRPLSLRSVRFKSSSGVDRPINILGRKQFMEIPNKVSTGKANQCYFSPKVTAADFYVWPTADDVGDCLAISYCRRIQDIDSVSNNVDIPQECLEAATYNLALRLAPAFGINLAKRDPAIALIAASSLQDMMLGDSEQGSIHVVPNYREDY